MVRVLEGHGCTTGRGVACGASKQTNGSDGARPNPAARFRKPFSNGPAARRAAARGETVLRHDSKPSAGGIRKVDSSGWVCADCPRTSLPLTQSRRQPGFGPTRISMAALFFVPLILQDQAVPKT